MEIVIYYEDKIFLNLKSWDGQFFSNFFESLKKAELFDRGIKGEGLQKTNYFAKILSSRSKTFFYGTKVQKMDKTFLETWNWRLKVFEPSA